MRMLDHKGLYCYIYYNRYVKATYLWGKSSKNQHIRPGITAWYFNNERNRVLQCLYAYARNNNMDK